MKETAAVVFIIYLCKRLMEAKKSGNPSEIQATKRELKQNRKKYGIFGFLHFGKEDD